MMTLQPDIELGNPAPPRLYAPPSTCVAIAASPNGPPLRRGARVVDWDGLENRCASDGTVGSNPTLSSNISMQFNEMARYRAENLQLPRGFADGS